MFQREFSLRQAIGNMYSVTYYQRTSIQHSHENIPLCSAKRAGSDQPLLPLNDIQRNLHSLETIFFIYIDYRNTAILLLLFKKNSFAVINTHFFIYIIIIKLLFQLAENMSRPGKFRTRSENSTEQSSGYRYRIPVAG